MNLIQKTLTALLVTSSLVVSSQAAKISPDENLISMVSEKKATGDVKKVYDEIKGAFGMVPNAVKQLSASPAMMKNSWELVHLMMENKNFSPKMLAMMRMVVGGESNCHYCVGANEGLLVNMFKLPLKDVQAIKKDPHAAVLDPKQKEMLLFLVKSTSHSKSVTRKDIDALKKLGWSEKDIVEGVRYAANIVAVTISLNTFKIYLDM